MRGIKMLVATVLLMLATPAGAAQDATIATFFGNWGGTAIAQNRDSLYFGVTIRDLDVTISGTGSGSGAGFDISWTTVFRRGGTPDKPRIRRKTTTLGFAAMGNGIFQAKDAARAGPGNTYSWARLEGNSLIVYIFAIDGRGIYQLSRYNRTLTGSGMELEFSVNRDGEVLRTVTGRLVKHR